MMSYFTQFFQKLFESTGGFIPTYPMGRACRPGDLIQFHEGEMILLGNIFHSGLLQPDSISIQEAIPQNQARWNLSSGVSVPYSGRSSPEGPAGFTDPVSRQALAFQGYGSFKFKAESPRSVGIANWNEIRDELTIKLTQISFAFREVFLVTDVASSPQWTLAIAADHQSKLELEEQSSSLGLANLFGQSQTTLVRAESMAFYKTFDHDIPSFFKVKKLTVADQAVDNLKTHLLNLEQELNSWAQNFFHDPLFESSGSGANAFSSLPRTLAIDLMSGQDIHPNTALLYFAWKDPEEADLAGMIPGSAEEA